MFDPNFENLKNLVFDFLNGSSEFTQKELFEKIKSDVFTGVITESEGDYLINQLPINTDSIEDDGKSYIDNISSESGGISLDDVGFALKKNRELDEFDLIQPDEKEPHFGFEEVINNTNEEEDDSDFSNMSNEDLDFLIGLSDNFEEREEENESGFTGLL